MADNYPKWITPHSTHITTSGKDGKPIAAKWKTFAVNPVTGTLQVLVNNVDEENKANAAAT